MTDEAPWADAETEADRRRFYLEDDEILLIERFRELSPDDRAVLLAVAKLGAPFSEWLVNNYPRSSSPIP